MESGEHMPDKKKVDSSHFHSHTLYFDHITFLGFWFIEQIPMLNFHVIVLVAVDVDLCYSTWFCWLCQFVSELARVVAPGGTIILVTWCHRDLSPSEESLKPEEKALLDKICSAYYLPDWCSTTDYVKLLESLSLQVPNLTINACIVC